MKKTNKNNKKGDYENFNKMNSEQRYFWGLFIICFIDIFLLLKEKIEPFYFVTVILFLYLIFKDKVKDFIGGL